MFLLTILSRCWRRLFKKRQHILVIFPGFGILPQEYKIVIPEHVPTIFLNIWSTPEMEHIQKYVGPPGTDSYNTWYEKKILECEDVILEHLKLRKNEDFKLVYFGHSLGGLMAQDCASRSKRRIRVICYGTNRKNEDAVMILGSNDMLIRKYSTTLPKSTEKTIIIEGGTHFSCVTKQGMQRSEKWRRRLHIDKIPEPYENFIFTRSQIANHLRSYIGVLNSYKNIK